MDKIKLNQHEGHFNYLKYKYELSIENKYDLFFSYYQKDKICFGKVKQLTSNFIEGINIYLNYKQKWCTNNKILNIKLSDIISIDKDIENVLPDYKSEEKKILDRISKKQFDKPLVSRVTSNIVYLEYFACNYDLIDILCKKIFYYITTNGNFDYPLFCQKRKKMRNVVGL